jgi:hypothetical protein
MIPDVHLLLLEYGQQHERTALELLIPTLHRVFPGTLVRVTVIDNALDDGSHCRLGPAAERIGGDNRAREFSGWDRGLAWIDGRHAPSGTAIVVLANDTVVRDDKAGRVTGLPADRTAAAVADGALVGWVEEYPLAVQLFGLEMRQWVDTSFVLAQRRTLATLAPLAAAAVDDQVFADAWPQLFREPSALSENYRRYLRTYFVGDCSAADFSHAWYAPAPLTESTAAPLKAKLQCLFQQHLLSARARVAGIPLVDIRPNALPIDPIRTLKDRR